MNESIIPGLTGDGGNPPSDSEEDKCLRRGIRNLVESGLSLLTLGVAGVIVPIWTEEPNEASPNSTDLYNIYIYIYHKRVRKMCWYI